MIWDELHTWMAQRMAEGLLRHRPIVHSPCGRHVVIDGQKLLAFCSNDYLSLANHPDLITAAQTAARDWGVGSGASHLVSGHSYPHERLEQALADFVGRDRALYFATGYMANLAIVPALLERHDAVFSDKLNHASLIDAAILSRAEHIRYPHKDVGALADRLARSPARRKLILTDAVFSMDGDIAPLRDLFALAEQHDAWLVVDDAHGFGVLGPQGRGTIAHFDLPPSPRLILMGTLGKAAGVSGAFVAGDQQVIAALMQRARTYIFTTASSPILAVAIEQSLHLIREGDDRRAHLHRLIQHLRAGLQGLPWTLLPSDTAIQPLLVGDAAQAVDFSQRLRAHGLWVPAIRPPTVPMGTARLRITLSCAHTAVDIDQLITALQACAVV